MATAPDTRLLEALKAVATKVQGYQGRVLGEQNTKASLIDPVLEALGWDIRDPEEVCREFRPTRQDCPVDYALKIEGRPRLLLEAKGLGEDLSDRRWVAQILGYATMAGVSWCVLTDGAEYRIYNSAALLAAEGKLLCRIKVSEDEPAAMAGVLELLSRGSLQENLIQACWNAHLVDRQTREVLEHMVGQGHPDLVRAVRAHAPTLSAKEVAASLRRLRVTVESVRQLPGALPDIRRGTTASATPGEPQPAVITLQELIEAGLLKPPLSLFRKYKGRRVEALLTAEGAVEFQGKKYHACSAAAEAARRAVTGKSMNTNGWEFWHYDGGGGRPRTLDWAREELRRRS
jgi:hypothetical protein